MILLANAWLPRLLLLNPLFCETLEIFQSKRTFWYRFDLSAHAVTCSICCLIGFSLTLFYNDFISLGEILMRCRAEGCQCIIIAHSVQPWLFSLSMSIHIAAWHFIQQNAIDWPETGCCNFWSSSCNYICFWVSPELLTSENQRKKKNQTSNESLFCLSPLQGVVSLSCTRSGGRSHTVPGAFLSLQQDGFTWECHRPWVTKITPSKWHWIVTVAVPVSNPCPHLCLKPMLEKKQEQPMSDHTRQIR